MKKLLVILMAGLILAIVLTGCGKQEEEPSVEPQIEETTQPAAPDTTMMEDTMDTTMVEDTTGMHEGH